MPRDARAYEEAVGAATLVPKCIPFPAKLPQVALERRRRQTLVREPVRMNAHDEHFLVLRAVEDPDLSPGGQS